MALPAVPPGSSRGLPAGPPVFTEEEVRCLEDDAIFMPPRLSQRPLSSGKRKVSAAFTPPRTVSSSSSRSSASVSTQGFQPDVIKTFDMPVTEESVEVLEYIGFVTHAASLIYERYLGRPNPDQNPDDLMAYVSGHLALLNSSRYIYMSPREALRDVGLTVQIQEAITDPRFSHIFGTQTLLYWANDTIKTNYAGLLNQQRVLRSHANERMARKGKKRPRHETNLPQEQLPGPSQQPPTTATINMTPRDFQFPEAHVAMQADADILENHVSLYKGKAHEELTTADAIIDDNGVVNLGALGTLPGADLNSTSMAIYWTPERETAEEYRRYAARRCPNNDTCVVHIQLPRSFIESLHMEELWYSRNWKEYIWTCRKGRWPDPKFDALWRSGRADIVKGHICSSMSKQIARIRQEDVQTHISEDNVLRLPSGRKATQWVFVQESSMRRLAEEVQGKMHFTIVRATGSSSLAPT